MNTRKNCPRIQEIEEQLASLAKELHELVQPTKDEADDMESYLEDVSRDDSIEEQMAEWFTLDLYALDLREDEEKQPTSGLRLDLDLYALDQREEEEKHNG